MTMRIGKRAIGPDHPVYIIAEAGVNHDGSPQKALELVRAAARAGADAVKFQYFESARLLSRASRLAAYQERAGERDPLDMLARLELSPSALGDCVREAHALGIHAIVSVFSVELVPEAARLPWDAFKAASPDVINRPLLDAMASTGRPLIVSTGASTLDEVARMLGWLRHAHDRLAVLHCVSAYPTPDEAANPFGVHAILDIFPGPVGYSDHTTRVDFGRFMMGCRCVMLEKHLTLDRGAPGPDHAASLEPGQFADYVAQAREAWQNHYAARVMMNDMDEAMKAELERRAPGVLKAVEISAHGLDPKSLGVRVEKTVLPIEEDVRLFSRQSLTTTRELPAGHALGRDDLTIKRPGTGLPPYELEAVLGRRLVRDVGADLPLMPEDLA
jgi:N,N'-diacetyllegionaminate synthase